MRNISSFVFLLFSLNIYLFSQNGDLPLVALVREGNISAMKKALHHVDMNATYGEDGETLLYHAIDSRQLKAARFLLKKGADPNMRTDGKTPLIFAIGTQNADMAELLLNFGADVNGKDEKGNTPLIYAAYLGNIELARLLVSEGANYNYRNAAKKTALDYAIQFRNSNVSAYFRTLNADSETRNYPDFHDGPHIVWNGASGPFAFYMYRDSLSDAVGFETEQLPARKDSFLLRGFAGDTLDYFIRKTVPPDQAEYEQVPRIFVLGDIHGRYDEVQQILLEHEVMDSSLNWSWGNGHLLFIGDIFDRGDEVTQILWLIYRLEYQAKKAGGRVHYVLGNHELMIMESDQRDISTKYFYLTSSLGVNYSDLFTLETELGRWLRNKPVMVRLNDILFVHAGISPSMLDSGMDIGEVNRLMRDYLHGKPDTTSLDKLELILDDTGPLWFRGYFQSGKGYQRADSLLLNATLDHFSVNRIIVGHTNVHEITPLYHGRVIATDIPFYSNGVELQALLIQDGKMFRAKHNGVLEPLDTDPSPDPHSH